MKKRWQDKWLDVATKRIMAEHHKHYKWSQNSNCKDLWAKSAAAKLTTFIRTVIVAEANERAKEAAKEIRRVTELAFGGCKKCYGKGYSTEMVGNTLAYRDFLGDMPTHVVKKSHVVMNFCKCDRGRELDGLIRLRLEEFSNEKGHSKKVRK